MSAIRTIGLAVLASFAAVMAAGTPAAAQQRPNIIMIMGDDVGWANIGVYNQGIGRQDAEPR
jgi:arylsulfatase